MPSSHSPSLSNRDFKPVLMVLAVAIVAVSVALLTGLVPRRSPSMITAPAGSNVAPEVMNDIASLVKRVGRHVLVVDPQTPSVATIENADELRSKNPYFYSNAQNGDRLLIWRDKAVLYSPSKDIVLSVLPVFVADVMNLNAPSGSQASAQASEIGIIEVRNGSGLSGMGRTIASRLQEGGLSVVLPPGDARSKTKYAKTLIYVAPGKSLPKMAAQIQALVGGEIVTTPPEEGDLRGDVLVMIGLDVKR